MSLLQPHAVLLAWTGSAVGHYTLQAAVASPGLAARLGMPPVLLGQPLPAAPSGPVAKAAGSGDEQASATSAAQVGAEAVAGSTAVTEGSAAAAASVSGHNAAATGTASGSGATIEAGGGLLSADEVRASWLSIRDGDGEVCHLQGELSMLQTALFATGHEALIVCPPRCLVLCCVAGGRRVASTLGQAVRQAQGRAGPGHCISPFPPVPEAQVRQCRCACRTCCC